jgi:hypothetical protein
MLRFVAVPSRHLTKDVLILYDCRNCLVGAGYTLKICDWALLRSTYTACYYRTQADEALPLRWMAWEAFLMVGSALAHNYKKNSVSKDTPGRKILRNPL